MPHKKKRKEEVGERSLEYYIDNFHETCEACGQKVVVHAFRKRTPVKKQAIYASCANKGVCRKAGWEICYLS